MTGRAVDPLLAALAKRGAKVEQVDEITWRVDQCPRCGRPLTVREVIWNNGKPRAARPDCGCREHELTRDLGLSDRDLYGGVQGASNGAGPGPSRDAGGDARALAFCSPAELRATVPPDPPWVWEGYLAAGTATLLAGKPKVGKSTLACAIIEAVVDRAESFLGRPITGGPVVYVSEEGAGTLAPKLPDHDDLRVLTRDAAWPKPPWAELIAAAVGEARRVGAVLLVIDTFAYWSALGAKQEKDAGSVQDAMDQVTAATGSGLAVAARPSPAQGRRRGRRGRAREHRDRRRG